MNHPTPSASRIHRTDFRYRRFENWHDYQALGLVSLLFLGHRHPVRMAERLYEAQLFGIRRLVDAVSWALMMAHEFGLHDRHELAVEKENEDLWHVIERIAKELRYGVNREFLLHGNDGFAITSRVRRWVQEYDDMKRRERLRGALGKGLPQLWLRLRDYSLKERELIASCLSVKWYENTDPELRLYVRDYLPSERLSVDRSYTNVRWIEWDEPSPLSDPSRGESDKKEDAE